MRSVTRYMECCLILIYNIKTTKYSIKKKKILFDLNFKAHKTNKEFCLLNIVKVHFLNLGQNYFI